MVNRNLLRQFDVADDELDPDPPLLGAEKDWAEKWLDEKGLRPRKKPSRRKGKPKSR